MATTAPRTQRGSPVRQAGERLAHYHDPEGRRREIIILAGARCSTLVVDRIIGRHGDARLIAHLSADEPRENAGIVCGMYLREERQPCCRLLSAEDMEIDPIGQGAEPEPGASHEPEGGVLSDSARKLYNLRSAPDGPALSQLRWHLQPPGADECAELVTLRRVTGALERYQPAVGLTEMAITPHEFDEDVSVTVLRAELRVSRRARSS